MLEFTVHGIDSLAMLLPDAAIMQTITAWVSVVAAVGGLLGLLMGLFSVVSGRDHWPKQIGRIRRRMPASQEDQRRHGMTLVLNGAAALIIIMGISINTVGVRDHSLGEPLNTLRFVLTLIGLAGAVACTVGAYSLSLTYTDSRSPAAVPPVVPSI